MQIGKRLFPYPVLNNAKNYSCYIESNYELEYEIAEDKENLYLKNVKVITNNDDLKQMICNKKVKAMIIIECSATVFKLIEEISLIPKDIVIAIGNLNGKVEVSSIVYVNEDIKGYHSKDFIDEFAEYKFNIEKYCVFAIDDGFTLKIEYDDFEDKKVSSIFSVIESYNAELNCMRIINDDRKIRIELPQEEHKKFKKLNGDKDYFNIFFSMIIVPALTTCLKDLQNEIKYHEKTIEDLIDNHTWFLAIKNAYKKITTQELDEENFVQLDAFEFSQLIMDSCNLGAINDFYNIITRIKDEPEDEEV